MNNIEQIHRDIQKLYEGIEEPRVQIPLPLRAYQLAHVAQEYIGAASLLDKEGPRYWLPRLNLTGHAMECSLKACLAATDTEPPNKHDLVELCRLAAKEDFQLDDRNVAAIVHLHHFYYQDLTSGTKFKARYPTKASERLGGAVPTNSTFVSIIRSLIEQAAQKTAYPFRKMFDTMQILRPA